MFIKRYIQGKKKSRKVSRKYRYRPIPPSTFSILQDFHRRGKGRPLKNCDLY